MFEGRTSLLEAKPSGSPLELFPFGSLVAALTLGTEAAFVLIVFPVTTRAS